MLEASYVQNKFSLRFTQGFCQQRLYTLVHSARGGLRDVSDRGQPQEYKAFPLSSATKSAIASVYKWSFSRAT
jgi:hypothetical protein